MAHMMRTAVQLKELYDAAGVLRADAMLVYRRLLRAKQVVQQQGLLFLDHLPGSLPFALLVEVPGLSIIIILCEIQC